MTIIYITGLSGVGKTSVLEFLDNKGYDVVDSDYDFTNYSLNEYILDEDKITQLLDINKDKHLFISGCSSNQGKFYSYFDHVILLTAELDVMLERVKNRTNNPYGKSAEDQNEIIDNYHTVLPLLKKRATMIIDTTNRSIEEICLQLQKLL